MPSAETVNRADEIESLYRDQAPSILGWSSAVYTSYGIHELDSRFCQAIKAAATVDECRYIFRRLAENEHLHPNIKENLALNLTNHMQSVVGGFGPSVHVCGSVCIVARRPGHEDPCEVKVCIRRHIEEL